MLEDKLLIWNLKRGSRTALERIYAKYRTDLLTLATALLHDVHAAEDVVHDVFVTFAQSGRTLTITGSLKGYLTTSVANRARDRIRSAKRQAAPLDNPDSLPAQPDDSQSAVCNESMLLLSRALEQLPYEQREAVILHIRGQMTFKAIAQTQNLPIQTVQSRYRYGLDKLRVILNGEVTQ